jgi:hypothetical protein
MTALFGLFIIIQDGRKNKIGDNQFVNASAFAQCKRLKNIALPMNLHYIGERVFEDCPNLETVTLSRKTRIGLEAFEGFKGRLVYRD